MPKYKVTINTDSYKLGRCSKKNWEPGTRNDYMLAINGLTRTLYSLKEVIWQIELFRGNYFLSSEYDEIKYKEENYHLSDKYVKFLEKNTIKYYDRLCGFERKQYLCGYGWMQGYFDINKPLTELKEKGVTQIPFKWLYDIRQYDKAMDNCYMEIKKIEKSKPEQIIVSNIIWDAPKSANLPKKIVIEINDANKYLLEDIEGYAENLSDYLSDTYEYCHEGFNVKYIKG